VNHKSEHYRLLIKDKRCQREKQNEIEVLSSDQISVEIAQMLERFRLDGEVAVITGGGNGIGRATAAALVEAGAAVALLDRDEKAVKETETAFVPPVQKLKPIFSTSHGRLRSSGLVGEFALMLLHLLGLRPSSSAPL
jgi:short chain dehydrogenase